MKNFKDVPIYERMGYELKLLREQRKWTQEKMGKKTGLSRDKICDLERGKVVCNVEALEALAKECKGYIIYMLAAALWGKEDADNNLRALMGQQGFDEFIRNVQELGPVHEARAYERDEMHMRSDKEE